MTSATLTKVNVSRPTQGPRTCSSRPKPEPGLRKELILGQARANE